MKNKIILVLILIGGVGVALWSLIPTPSLTHPSPHLHITKKNISQDILSKNIKIKKIPQQYQENKNQILLNEKKVKDYTYNYKRNYQIILLDENPMDENVTSDYKYKKIIGEIDGSRFVLRIPEESIQNGKLELIIKNIKTGQIKSIDANFLKDVGSLGPKEQFYLKLDFNNLSNYESEIKERKRVLPIPME